MTNLLFSGCSYSVGAGLVLEKDDSSNYTRIFSNEIFGNNHSLTNISISGYSNLRIFIDSITTLLENKYDYAFIGWTSYPRFVSCVGLEECNCMQMFNPSGTAISEHKGNEFNFSKKFLKDVCDKLSLIQHPHYDILDIVKYVNILKNLETHIKTKIYFINNLCHWDYGYFTQQANNIKPSHLSQYTNQILNSNNRDDDQIERLYVKIHNDYNSVGGIQESKWLNLYHNFKSHSIDLGSDNLHPGPKSHISYGKFLASQFKLKSV